MNLIDKIQEYVHGVCNKERKIRGDKEEYSHGKFAVASVVSKLIEDHEPEPPKTATEIATKYVKGQHDALTDNQEIKNLAREIEAYKNQPPTVRPMSELPESNDDIHVLILHEGKRLWVKGVVCLNRVELNYLNQDCWMQRNYTSDIGVKALRWLPFRELPNPNDIKP